MTVYCVDPGAVASGVAKYHDNSIVATWFVQQFAEPIDVFWWIQETACVGDTILVEDYSHGGTFTREAKDTLKIVGYLEYALRAEGYNVHLVNKDKRLSGQGEAAKLMGGEVKALKNDPTRKDAFAALSHCIVHQREESTCT